MNLINQTIFNHIDSLEATHNAAIEICKSESEINDVADALRNFVTESDCFGIDEITKGLARDLIDLILEDADWVALVDRFRDDE